MAANKKKATARHTEDTPVKSFLDMIAPSVVQFNPDHFICGNTFRCVWALREYPTQTDEQALLRHLGEKDGITLRIYTRQLTPAEEDRILHNAANKNRMNKSNPNDLRQTIIAETNLQDMISMEGSRHRNKEPLFHCAVYTDKIMSNSAWTLAGIFADKGITGTSVKKREDFMRMIRHCRQKKIDVVLTKSVSRFARNTVDCLYYTRALKELGIAVIFEKENINSLEEDSELRITLSGAFAQSESESISANVTWGKRRAMESGKATIQYKYLYGYRRGADDKPEIIPEEAEVVRWIYERYLAGASTRMLRDELHEQGVTYSEKSPQWTLPHIKSILRNEKYCGDVLMQKTFQQDVINRKVIKNTGQLPMYLIENHHEGIVSREKYNAVQAEMARRKAAKSPSKRAATGLSAYTSRYALSDRLVCGECGTLYRRCTWTRPDGKRVVWRCVSRLDYGKKYCHSSPTLDEVPLQQAIIAALNTVLPDLDGRIRQITEALEAEVIPFPGSGMSLGDIDRRLTELEVQFQRLLEKAADDPIAYGDQFKEILDEQTALKELRATILAENKEHAEADRRIRDAAGILENAVPHIAEWDETAIRQLVAQVKVLSKNEISVTLKSGIEIRQSISN